MVDRGSGEIKAESMITTIAEVLPIANLKSPIPGIKVDGAKHPMVKTLIDKLDMTTGSLLKLKPTVRPPNNDDEIP